MYSNQRQFIPFNLFSKIFILLGLMEDTKTIYFNIENLPNKVKNQFILLLVNFIFRF